VKFFLWGTAAIAVIAVASCRKVTQPPVMGDSGLVDSAEQVIWDGDYKMTEAGVQRGQLLADTIFVFNDQTKFVLRRVRAKFNTELGAPNGTLRGNRGTFDRRTKILEGFGNVVVTSTKGDSLMSNHLRYNQTKDEVSSDSAFTLIRGGDIQRGVGFRSDPNLNTFKCLSSCRGVAKVPLGDIRP